MSKARMIADTLIDRARTIWRMTEGEQRFDARVALLDITIDVATDLATETMQLIDQYTYAGPARQLRAMRDALTLWRKIMRAVKSVNSGHPINEMHFYLVLLDSWGTRLNRYEKVFPVSCATELKVIYARHFDLRQYTWALDSAGVKAQRKTARNRIQTVLQAYAGG